MKRFAPALGMVLLMALLVGGLSRLRFDVEILNLLPQSSSAVQGLRTYQEQFANAGELVIAIEAYSPSFAESAAASLASALRNAGGLAKQVTWRPPWIEFPNQATELAAYQWINQPPDEVRELANRLAPGRLADELAQTQDRLATTMSPAELATLAYDPYRLTEVPNEGGMLAGSGDELFVSQDGRFRLIFVQANRDLSDYRACIEWLEEVKTVVQRWQAEFGRAFDARVGYTGRPAFVAEIAGGMEGDIITSVGGASAIIAFLFFLVHRRLAPLLWLIFCMGLILLITYAVGGLLFESLNVVSAGFAAILLGLAVDYGLILYQEAQHSNESVAVIRGHTARSIIWSSSTTAAAFLILSMSRLPGLSQLGALVAVGIVAAALTMMFIFLPLSCRKRAITSPAPALDGPASRPACATSVLFTAASLLVLLVAAFALWRHPPALSASPDALRPKDSDAHRTLDWIKTRMDREEDPLWLTLSAPSETVMADRIAKSKSRLDELQARGWLSHFTLPASLWPNPAFQAQNRPVLGSLADRNDELFTSAVEVGFTTNALGLTSRITATWNRFASSSDAVFWPTNHVSQWVLGQFTARGDNAVHAIGLLHLTEDGKANIQQIADELAEPETRLAGWELLGVEILDIAVADFWRIITPVGVLVLVALWLAYGRVGEMALSVAALLFSLLILVALMGLLGWQWNLLNLMALPLILGAGIDYSIHMQLALKRHGSIRAAQVTTGRALTLCAASTIAAFSSLTWAGNAGLASLGQACALGILITFLTAVLLAPHWRAILLRPRGEAGAETSTAHNS